jgi:hypothetical protein
MSLSDLDILLQDLMNVLERIAASLDVIAQRIEAGDER